MFYIRLEFDNVHLGTNFFGPYSSQEEAEQELTPEKGWKRNNWGGQVVFVGKWREIFSANAQIFLMKKLSESSYNFNESPVAQ